MANLFSDGSERVPYENPDFPIYASRSWLSALENMRFAHHWHDDLGAPFPTAGDTRPQLSPHLH